MTVDDRGPPWYRKVSIQKPALNITPHIHVCSHLYSPTDDVFTLRMRAFLLHRHGATAHVHAQQFALLEDASVVFDLHLSFSFPFPFSYIFLFLGTVTTTILLVSLLSLLLFILPRNRNNTIVNVRTLFNHPTQGSSPALLSTSAGELPSWLPCPSPGSPLFFHLCCSLYLFCLPFRPIRPVPFILSI